MHHSGKRFQFHKVRLKVLLNIDSKRTTWFQFHKVRLKVGEKLVEATPMILFQFHKVRLKDGKMTNDIHVLKCFNSIRYD